MRIIPAIPIRGSHTKEGDEMTQTRMQGVFQPVIQIQKCRKVDLLLRYRAVRTRRAICGTKSCRDTDSTLGNGATQAHIVSYRSLRSSSALRLPAVRVTKLTSYTVKYTEYILQDDIDRGADKELVQSHTPPPYRHRTYVDINLLKEKYRRNIHAKRHLDTLSPEIAGSV